MRGYNRMNLLRKMVDIQNITIEHTEKGVTQEWVYSNIIYPRYCISRTTYYAYLKINAKAELKKLKNAENKRNGGDKQGRP